MNQEEEALFQAFVIAEKRRRYLTLLSGDRRNEALDALNHFRDFDPRWTTPIPKGTDVVSLLRSQGARDRCYVLSDSEAIDGQVMSLKSAVKAAKASPWGTLIGCVRGKVAYYRGENGEQELLLLRAG